MEVETDVIDLSSDESSSSDENSGSLNRCQFCLKLPNEQQHVYFPTSHEKELRGKIEYVLATQLDADGLITCCRSCWTTFQSFYEFKSCCLTMMDLRKQMIESEKTNAAKEGGKRLRKKKRKRGFPPGFVFCCPGCKDHFTSLGKLERHKQECIGDSAGEESEPERADEDGRFRCLLCAADFSQSSALRYHMNKHYGRKKYVCRNEGCGQAFFNASVRSTHAKECGNNDKYECTICGAKLKTSVTLQTHMKLHVTPNKECAICNASISERAFARHWRNHFGQPADGDAELPDEADYKVAENLPAALSCELCEKVLPTEVVYELHQKHFHGGYKNSSFESKFLCCSLCPKKFTSKDRYQDHIDKHNGIRSVPCKNAGCTKMFFDQHSRNSHLTYCGKIRQCTVCGGTFKYLTEHMKLHTEGPPACSICGKTFSSRRNLARHVESHTISEPRFTCDLCDKRFTQNSSLKTHLKNVHNAQAI